MWLPFFSFKEEKPLNTEMKNRIFFGTLMIAVMVLVVFLSPLTRLLGFLAVGIACAWEYKTRLKEKDIPVALWILVVFLVAAAALAWTNRVSVGWPVLLGASVMLTMGYGVYEKSKGGVAAVYTLSGILYPGFLFALVMHISQTSWWLQTLMLACLSTWVCDSAAMLGGRRFGKHKLAATVSPNKTVEGAVWGAASSLVVGVICWLLGRWFPAVGGMNLIACMVTCLLASTMGQLGDLAESLLKRMLGVKDFSNLIPGHGGMFDRADSLLFSIPTAYLCIMVYTMLAV